MKISWKVLNVFVIIENLIASFIVIFVFNSYFYIIINGLFFYALIMQRVLANSSNKDQNKRLLFLCFIILLELGSILVLKHFKII